MSPALTSTVSFTSPHVSPSISRFTKVARTPYLGPALRVPIAQTQTQKDQQTHQQISPVKQQSVAPSSAAVHPSTVTPRKRTPTSARTHTAYVAGQTPLPKLEWNSSPQKPMSTLAHQASTPAISAYHPSAYEARSRSASNVSRQDTPPGLDHSEDGDLTDDSFDGRSTPMHNSSVYFHPANEDSPGALPRATLTPNHLFSRGDHVSSAADWTARLAAAASSSGTASPGAISPTSGMASPRVHEKGAADKQTAWPLNSQQLAWLMNEAEQYDMHAQ